VILKKKEGMITLFNKKIQLLEEIYLAKMQFRSPELERDVNTSIRNQKYTAPFTGELKEH
jgi:hypothetical protein